MDLDLTGKRALVTGSTRGIGFAAAAGLAGMGAEVVVNGRDKAAVDEAHREDQAGDAQGQTSCRGLRSRQQ
jgi:NAD(P)-dependent dehydrogenase (short-subunit alcohol dehydrogenase family)